MATCWVCHEEINLNNTTCWPAEGIIGVGHHPIVTDSPTHQHCIVTALGHRGPGGQTISGYQRGATRPNGAGLILHR